MPALARMAFAALTGLMAGSATAQGTPLAGIDYYEVKPPPSAEAQESIQVVEYFWYRCPHCYALEPLLESWTEKLPAEVRFGRVPAVMRTEWAIDARIFYALEAMGEAPRLHRPLFDAIHQEERARLKGEAYTRWISGWLSGQGVDIKRYEAALHSSAVARKVRSARTQARDYQLEGTPAFVVAQRYVVNAPPGDRRRILAIVDYLVSRVQAETLARR